MTRQQLEQIRQWADEKIATGAEPPWSWYQLMKLREALDAILAGMPSEMSSPRGHGPRLVGKDYPENEANPETTPVQLPM